MLVGVKEVNGDTYMLNPEHIIMLRQGDKGCTYVHSLAKVIIVDEEMYELAERLDEEGVLGRR
jgi:uncharacterized protein YlzI (FlbEa/FlbD family)